MYSRLYGQCRSINNATSAEVKEACLSGGGVCVCMCVCVGGGEETEGDKEIEVMGE